MKKFIAVIAAAFIAAAAFADITSIEAGVKLGVGPTAGTIFDGGGKTYPQCAFNFGLYGHMGFLELGPGVLAAQAEFNFTFGNGGRQGMSVYNPITNTMVYNEVVIKFPTMDIPLLVCYDIELGPVSLRPLAGFQFAFPIGKYEINRSKGDQAKGFLFGVVFGCGVAYEIGPIVLNGDVRYTIDCTKFKASNGTNLGRRGSLMFNIGAAYKFDL